MKDLFISETIMKPRSTQRSQSRFVCAHSALSASSVVNRSTRSSLLAPRALTLVELLVVIVILTTLVAGVVPVLSPNNDVRKIREASRGLQSYITLAQARAARTGRPQGIAFRESSPGSGVALEVFGLEVPPPFAGFSTESRVNVGLVTVSPTRYGPAASVTDGNDRDRFSPRYNNFPLYQLRFELIANPPTPPLTYTPDQLPPRTFQVGDVINVGSNQFLIVDDDRNREENFPPSTLSYVNPAINTGLFADSLICVWLNSSGQLPPRGLKSYQIDRAPKNSSESPYQLPAGIVIDMQGSIAEGSSNSGVLNRFPVGESLSINPTIPARTLEDFVGIMFSPTGAVSSIVFNNAELTNTSRIVLLLGRVENGGLIDSTNVNTQPWAVSDPKDRNEIEQKQQDINWLNLDSRLLSIATRSGRTTVSETAFVNLDPTTNPTPDADGDTATIDVDPHDQLEAAQAFAREMSTAR